jgi:hypothetical protein
VEAFLFMSAALLGIAGISTHADAQNHRWCGYYKEDVNCGFWPVVGIGYALELGKLSAVA